jgi:DNA modification methylase
MKIEHITDKITLYNCDCMEYMKEIPDRSIDIILCDLT